MTKPDYKQFGITKEQYDSVYGRKEKFRNYVFGISSAAGILGGCIYGVFLAKGLYEFILFILFFGCFLGAIFGGVFTLAVVALYTSVLYIISPAYRKCRKYRAALSKARAYRVEVMD